MRAPPNREAHVPPKNYCNNTETNSLYHIKLSLSNSLYRTCVLDTAQRVLQYHGRRHSLSKEGGGNPMVFRSVAFYDDTAVSTRLTHE